jgi:SAM-dependent methyltransferase
MTSQYHLAELEIAWSAHDPRRVMPIIPEDCRTILDVGCGAGQISIASRRTSKGVFFGVDVDFSALELGRELTKDIHFVAANGESLPFRDDSFDMLICRVTLPYMDVRRSLAEFRRVLKPNGLLWLVLHPFSLVAKHLVSSVRSGNLGDMVFRIYVIANGLALALTGRQFRFLLGRRRQESFQTEAGTRRALTFHGFSHIEIRQQQHFVATARKARL